MAFFPKYENPTIKMHFNQSWLKSNELRNF